MRCRTISIGVHSPGSTVAGAAAAAAAAARSFDGKLARRSRTVAASAMIGLSAVTPTDAILGRANAGGGSDVGRLQPDRESEPGTDRRAVGWALRDRDDPDRP